MEETTTAVLDYRIDDERDDEVVELTDQMVVAARPSALNRVVTLLVLLVLTTIPILFGAVQPWVWSLYTVVIYAAFGAHLWERHRVGVGLGINVYGVAVTLFLALALLACVPLPDFLLAWVSPVRHQLLQQAEGLSGVAAVWPTLSYAPVHSLGWWAFLLGLALLFVVLKNHFVSALMFGRVCRILLILAVVEGLYGIVQALVPNLGVLWVGHLTSGLGDARGTWINRNHFAGFMAMMLPLLMGYAFSRVHWGTEFKFKTLLQSERVHQHSLFLLALVIVALAILFSKSRAGITSATVGMGVFLFLLRGRDQKLPRRVWLIAGGFLGLILLYGVRIGFEPIIERFLALDEGNTRLDYWKDSVAMVADHPMGIGLAAFKFVFPVYNITSVNEMISPHYLHNDLYQLLVETGWLGFGLLFSAYAVFMVNRFGQIRRMSLIDDPQTFFLTAGAFGGLASISMHSFFDFNMQVPANAVYFVLLLAMVRVGTTKPGVLRN